MKKAVAFLLLAALLAFQAGCAAAGTVSTDGSSSMEKVLGILKEAFEEEYGGAVSYNPTGSSSGIAAVAEGRCEIGLSSRALTQEEQERGLVGTVLAYDGVAVVVNLENPVEGLSMEQLAALFTGEAANWSQVGGRDAPVVPVGREAGSGTRDGFESATGTGGLCRYSQELTSTGDVVATVASNPNAVGYASLDAVGETVRAILVDGAAPTEEAVREGSYPLRRPFLLVTRSDAPLSQAAQLFFDFATSERAAGLIAQAGVVPAV
ncbi:MAG: phosphate ABC transporter substrate-binding protein [Oscillospiraceae bacterium]|nr:phosphate ABC transporter substrate-binding protein [Oscillospiraceae bacterium]